MKHAWKIGILIISLFLYSSCSPSQDVQPTTSKEAQPMTSKEAQPTKTLIPDGDAGASAAEHWVLNLFLSGGIAGKSRVLELTSTGDLLVVDEKTGQKVNLVISTSELEKIAGLVSEIDQSEKATPASCADCFQYEFFLQKGDQKFSATLNDLNLNSSALNDLIKELMALGNKALPE